MLLLWHDARCAVTKAPYSMQQGAHSAQTVHGPNGRRHDEVTDLAHCFSTTICLQLVRTFIIVNTTAKRRRDPETNQLTSNIRSILYAFLMLMLLLLLILIMMMMLL